MPSAFCDSAGYKSACGSKCPESESTDMHHVRGCMFAHRRALQAFVNTTAERFFVFEDDVTLPDAPLAWSRAATSEFVAAAKGKDLGYLGHCFDGLCTHALLWSRAGAQKAAAFHAMLVAAAAALGVQGAPDAGPGSVPFRPVLSTGPRTLAPEPIVPLAVRLPAPAATPNQLEEVVSLAERYDSEDCRIAIDKESAWDHLCGGKRASHNPLCLRMQ